MFSLFKKVNPQEGIVKIIDGLKLKYSEAEVINVHYSDKTSSIVFFDNFVGFEFKITYNYEQKVYEYIIYYSFNNKNKLKFNV